MICPRCTQPLPDWLLRDSHVSSICPHCQSAIDVYCFPALYRFRDTLDPAQLTLTEGDACCYEHSDKRAAAVCSNCGRFLCALCEVPLGRQILCPDCLSGQTGAEPQQVSLVSQRTKFDSIALALATWPLLLFYISIITAPLALIMSIYAWNRPSSLVRHSRWRIYTAVTLSSLEIAGMAVFIVFVLAKIKWNR